MDKRLIDVERKLWAIERQIKDITTDIKNMKYDQTDNNEAVTDSLGALERDSIKTFHKMNKLIDTNESFEKYFSKLRDSRIPAFEKALSQASKRSRNSRQSKSR